MSVLRYVWYLSNFRTSADHLTILVNIQELYEHPVCREDLLGVEDDGNNEP